METKTSVKPVYKYRVYGWRVGLHVEPMVLVETVEQAALQAIRMHAELLAFDSHVKNLGPCNIRVESVEEEGWRTVANALRAHLEPDAELNRMEFKKQGLNLN